MDAVLWLLAPVATWRGHSRTGILGQRLGLVAPPAPWDRPPGASGVKEGRVGLEAPSEVASLSPLAWVARCGDLFAWPCRGFERRRPTFLEK